LLSNDGRGDVEFESLQTIDGELLARVNSSAEFRESVPHDLLFESSPHDQSINVDDALLTQTMSTIHGLKILHGIPIMLDEDDSICRRQVESESSDVGSKKENVDRRVVVERLDDSVAFRNVGRSVHPHVRDRRHDLAEEIMFHDIEHLLELAEDQNAVSSNAFFSRLVFSP
jgi:hypothetical protein